MLENMEPQEHQPFLLVKQPTQDQLTVSRLWVHSPTVLLKVIDELLK
jgi:hypothetical protein